MIEITLLFQTILIHLPWEGSLCGLKTKKTFLGDLALRHLLPLEDYWTANALKVNFRLGFSGEKVLG